MLAQKIEHKEYKICKAHNYEINKEVTEAIEEGRRLANAPKVPRYKTLEELFASLEI